jgi:hypothetical protein
MDQRRENLPMLVPTVTTQFEVVTDGKVYTVTGADLQH